MYSLCTGYDAEITGDKLLKVLELICDNLPFNFLYRAYPV